MAEIVGGFLGPVVQLVGYILAPIKRQLNYLCCFSTNVQNLESEDKKLGDVKADLERKKVAEENNLQVIDSSVDTWLNKSNDIQLQMIEIKKNISDVSSGCLGIKSRFVLSKEVVKLSEAVKEHREGCKFDTISTPPPPASRQPIPDGKSRNFQSRKEIEEDVMKALKEGNVKMMGICGMGGLGKTTLAKKVMHIAREESLFDEIFMVVVGQDMDKLDIQLQIAQSLNLRLEENTLHLRAQKLHFRLTQRNDKILIVVDDIWDAVELEELGIPYECTILLTSRSMEVLKKMDAKVFTMQILNEEEAWSLFNDKSRIGVDNQSLVSIAKQVVKECKGLPLALQILGTALKHTSEHCWKDTLRLLRSSSLENVSDFLKEVYPSLKRSFDMLNDDAKKVLLLCSQFPEDSNIPLDELIMYCMGLRLFGEIRNVEETRDRLFTVAEILKNRSLLMDSEVSGNYVKMHDVVRDVAIVIAREKGLVDTNLRNSVGQSEWVFMFLDSCDVRHNHFVWSSYSKITLLSICRKRTHSMPLLIRILPSFDEMKELTSVIWKDVLLEFPGTIKYLENLRMLYLVRCNLKSISVFGELLGLEILVCYRCNLIEEVPIEIRRLKQLKILYFERCWNLKRIAPGVISNLTELEELKICECFSGWESTNVGEEERSNPTLKELESLTKLKFLCIDIEDVRLVVEDIHLSPSIINYEILFKHSEAYRDHDFGKTVRLCGLVQENNCANWIHELVRSTECLYLSGDGSVNFDLSQLHTNIKRLSIENCGSIEALLPTTTTSSTDWKASYGNEHEIVDLNGKLSSITFSHLKDLRLYEMRSLTSLYDGVKVVDFPVLERLWILNCRKFGSRCKCKKEIEEKCFLFCWEKVTFGGLKLLNIQGYNYSNIWCYQIPPSFFEQLTKLCIWSCHDITILFSSPIAKNLVNLKSLKVIGCGKIERVISNEGVEDCNKYCVLLPSLEFLVLWCLPLVGVFCEWSCALELPSLTEINIDGCPLMKSFTLGSLLSTPKLEGINLNGNIITIEEADKIGGLNGIIHHEHLKSRSSENIDNCKIEEENS